CVLDGDAHRCLQSFPTRRSSDLKIGTITYYERKGWLVVNNVYILEHPLIQHKLTYIRNVETGTKQFREVVNELSMLMGFEITRNLPMQDKVIQTPVNSFTAKELAGKKIRQIPILSTGLGMVDGMVELLPAARVGHIGLYRDPESLEPVEYYIKLPSDIEERLLIVLDPMLATGGSADDAINSLKKRGAKSIKLMCLVA